MSAHLHTPAFAPEPGAAIRRVEAQVRRDRRQALGAGVARSAVAAVASAALSLCVWQGWRWATSADIFQVNYISLTGEQHAEAQDLLRRSGLRIGENIFQADLARAARGIETHPWVVSARLERRLPHTIAVEVLEHRPAALVQLGTLYVLDDQGRLFKRATPEDALDVPLVTGLSRDEFQTNRAALQLRLLTALQLLDRWRAQDLSLAQLSEVRLGDDGSMTLFAVDHGVARDADDDELQEIRLGKGDLGLKLRRLVQVRAALARRGERALKIDLDHPSRPDQATAALAQKHR